MLANSVIFRVAAFLGSIASALLAVAILVGSILVLRIEPSQSGRLLDSAAYWFTILAGMVFCGLLSAALFRWARRDASPTPAQLKTV